MVGDRHEARHEAKNEEGSDVTMTSDLTGARGPLQTADGAVDIYRLDHLSDHSDIAHLPKTVKILLENLCSDGAPGASRRRPRCSGSRCSCRSRS